MFVVKNTTNEIGKSICFPRSFGILRVVIGVRHLWRAAAEGEIPEEKPARGGERATRARQNQGEINFCSFFRPAAVAGRFYRPATTKLRHRRRSRLGRPAAAAGRTKNRHVYKNIAEESRGKDHTVEQKLITQEKI